MAITIPSVQPESILLGDTLKFTFNPGDYTPDTYTATYRIISENNTYTVTGSDNGDNTFLFSATSAVTGAWRPGDYHYSITVTDGTDRYQLASGAVVLKPDPAAGGFDARSHVKKVLDQLEDLIAGRSVSDTSSYSIGGRSINKMTPEELLRWRDQYRAEYAMECQAERIAKGLGNPRKIKVRIR